MVAPKMPTPDAYDANQQIKPHFSKTPGLTRVRRGHRYNNPANSMVRIVRRHVGKLYRKYGITECPHHGLYWAGSEGWTSIDEREMTMLLVVELRSEEVQHWWKMDRDLRDMLEVHKLSGRHGVCLRYYEFSPVTSLLSIRTDLATIRPDRELDTTEPDDWMNWSHLEWPDVFSSPWDASSVANTRDQNARRTDRWMNLPFSEDDLPASAFAHPHGINEPLSEHGYHDLTLAASGIPRPVTSSDEPEVDAGVGAVEILSERDGPLP